MYTTNGLMLDYMTLIAKIPQKYNKIENEELFNLVEHLTKKPNETN